MQIALNTSPAHRHEGVDGRMIYCALLPLFVLAEGGRRLRRRPQARGRKPDARSLVCRGAVASVRRDVIRADGQIDVALIRAAPPPGTPVVTERLDNLAA